MSESARNFSKGWIVCVAARGGEARGKGILNFVGQKKKKMFPRNGGIR